MKTEIYSTFNYGAYSLCFKKTFELDFAPFFDLIIFDEVNETENSIRLENSDYCSTSIFYNTKDKSFYVDISNYLRKNTSLESLYEIVERFTKTEWERTDDTDLVILSGLLIR